MAEGLTKSPGCEAGNAVLIGDLQAMSPVEIGERLQSPGIELISTGVGEVLRRTAGIVINGFGKGIRALQE